MVDQAKLASLSQKYLDHEIYATDYKVMIDALCIGGTIDDVHLVNRVQAMTNLELWDFAKEQVKK